MDNCIFCKIVKKEIPAHIIWENADFIAFLDLYPAVPGATVVIPKKHYDSYIKNADPKITNALMDAAKKVMDLLDTKLQGNLRTKLIFEGLEIPHLHAKLWPMYKDIKEQIPTTPASQIDLEKLAQRLIS